MSDFNCAKCKTPIESTPKMEEIKANNQTAEFYCTKCRTDMVNERIMHHPTTRRFVEK